MRLTMEQLGAIVGYAAYDIEALRWILGMIATGCRPDAVLKWNVAKQWKGRGEVFDTHPIGAPKTKKRNAAVPVIDEFRPWLEAWADSPHPPVKSRKTWWRTMRDALELPDEIVPKTIRHTIATELRRRGVSLTDIAGLLGHTSESRITQVYAKYDPSRLPHVKQELSAIWGRFVHLRTTGSRIIFVSVRFVGAYFSCTKDGKCVGFLRIYGWWAVTGSNRRPSRCKR
jgi:integrase